MEKDKEYINGVFFKPPHTNAPPFVKSKVSIRRVEMISWLQQQEGEWINANLNLSDKTGRLYLEVDNWKPQQSQREAPPRQERTQPAGQAAERYYNKSLDRDYEAEASNMQSDLDDDIPF